MGKNKSAKKLKRKDYEQELAKVHEELVSHQAWCEAQMYAQRHP